MESSPYSQIPLLSPRIQNYFKLRLFDAMRSIDAHNRVILAEFLYPRVGLKCCIATSQKTADTTLTWLQHGCVFLTRRNEKFQPQEPTSPKYYIFSTSFATCVCRSPTLSQLPSDSRQAMLRLHGRTLLPSLEASRREGPTRPARFQM